MKLWQPLFMASLLLTQSLVIADSLVDWQAPDHQQHPLAGQVWSSEIDELFSLTQFIDDLEKGSWLLMGEQHDHPDHHQLQTAILAKLAENNRLGAVAFEMANIEQQPLLDEWLGRGDDVEPEQLNWSPGWPWERYQQQVRQALNHATRVIGADLPRTGQMQAYQQGAAEGQLDHAHSHFMMELIFTSHCEMLPRANLSQMLQVQLGRDQQMANAMAANTDAEKVNVLIAGSMHVRNDLGIPRWLSINNTSLILMSLEDMTEPSKYLVEAYPEFPVGELTSDFLLFTPTMPEQDYCAAFR
ncbi:ChaN family lipoprotein [Nitrincola schmidtii]|uniref:ChaN family lipoprotein n=1 Tax=Nitrincola schmidtii TaxID=1730894 RepID=UPI00124EB290|nr:ChaN family lipoprotein [Nitrincola schmidtii]